MATTTVYTYFGTVAKFNSDAVTSGTTLNTNLVASYVVQSVVPSGTDPITGQATYLFVLQTGGAL